MVGFVVGATLGVAVGLLTSRTRFFRFALNPILSLCRPVPAIAIVPVAIVWFGIGDGSKYFVISYGVFLTVWLATHHGMEHVADDIYPCLPLARRLDVARILPGRDPGGPGGRATYRHRSAHGGGRSPS